MNVSEHIRFMANGPDQRPGAAGTQIQMKRESPGSLRVGMVKHFQFHSAGVKALNTKRPNAISHPASATPRSERKKKGLTIRRNSHAPISKTPNKADKN